MLLKIYLNNFIAGWVPRICAVCGLDSNRNNIDLCDYCRQQLPWRKDSCYHCGLLLLEPNESIACVKCQDNLPSYYRVCVLFDYAAPLPRLIATLKFGRQLYPAEILGTLLAEKIIQNWYTPQSLPQVLIPVPLHKKRLRKRGYNQSVEICKPISKILKIPYDLAICRRVKYTQPQSKLKRSQRQRNLDAAFVVNNYKNYTHVAIIDDVVTTGSTVKAISKALLAAGVELVDVWCVCRA